MCSRLNNSILAFILCFSITGLAQIVVGPGSGSGGSSGGATWGSITGTLSDQTDLQTALDTKQDTITFGTGIETALGINIGSAGAPVLFNGALGTPTSGTLTNATGLPIAGITGLGANVGTWLATPSSANLASAVTGETGSGALVFGTTPTFTTSFILEAAGVSFAAADGVLTLLGLGNGNDEDLVLDLDNQTSNIIGFSSSTGANILNASSMAWRSTWNINGAIELFQAFNSDPDGNTYFGAFINSSGRAGIHISETSGSSPTEGKIEWRGDINSWLIDVDAGSDVYTFSGSQFTSPNPIQGNGYKSADGSDGVTVTTCTSFKNGLCVAGT